LFRKLSAENPRICVICRNAEVGPGKVTVTLGRGTATIVFKDVPVRGCPNCGEQYVDEAVTARLLEEAEEAGGGVEVRWYG
jgi:YgiT-type zinc finger domain-containing protein